MKKSNSERISPAERRQMLVKILSDAGDPVSGTALSAALGVSRQVIVQDIAILREGGELITSTTQGYVLNLSYKCSKVFKVKHTDEQVGQELSIIIDNGAVVKDVFVYHRVYGVVRAQMNIRSRRDIEKYILDMKSGKSTLLKNITSDYHYHTVLADSIDTLKRIEDSLWESGMLAKLQPFEPVSFD